MKNYHEIVTEAGRTKYHNKGYNKNKDIEDLPERESIRQPHKGTYKFEFRDKLGALMRAVWKGVGRPWDKVRDKILKGMGDGLGINHIKDHIKGWVQENPIMYEGKPYHPNGHWYWFRYGNVRSDQLWVDKYGILRKGWDKKPKPRKPDRYEIRNKDKYYYNTGSNHWFTFKEFSSDLKKEFNNAYYFPTKVLARKKVGEPFELLSFKGNTTMGYDKIRDNLVKKGYKDSEIHFGPFDVVYNKD